MGTPLILAMDNCLSTVNHLLFEVFIVVDWFISVGIAPFHTVLYVCQCDCLIRVFELLTNFSFFSLFITMPHTV